MCVCVWDRHFRLRAGAFRLSVQAGIRAVKAAVVSGSEVIPHSGARIQMVQPLPVRTPAHLGNRRSDRRGACPLLSPSPRPSTPLPPSPIPPTHPSKRYPKWNNAATDEFQSGPALSLPHSRRPLLAMNGVDGQSALPQPNGRPQLLGLGVLRPNAGRPGLSGLTL